MNNYLLKRFIEVSGSSITREQIEGKSRNSHISVARHAYWYCLKIVGLSHSEIARMARRSRGTVIIGIRNVMNYLEVNDPVIRPYKRVIDEFNC